jgi:hypothetical protein
MPPKSPPKVRAGIAKNPTTWELIGVRRSMPLTKKIETINPPANPIRDTTKYTNDHQNGFSGGAGGAYGSTRRGDDSGPDFAIR